MSFATARKKAGLTQTESATALGYKDNTAVLGWEKGKWLPRAALLPRIAALYGCTVDELLTADDTPLLESKGSPL